MARNLSTLTGRRVGVSGIYEIRHRPTDRCYIGSSVNIDLRWREHERHLARGVHKSHYLQRVWSKYGAGEFAFRILLRCKPADLVFYEQRCLDSFLPVFNSCPTAESQLGYRHSVETRAKMSASRPKDFSPMKGRRHSEATRRLISAKKKGRIVGPPSEETRRKISQAQKGRTVSPERRARISATLLGRKNGPPSEATRAKIGAGNRGRPKSPEHRAKLSAAMRRWRESRMERIS